MSESKNFIREVWDSQGVKFGESHEASWGDIEMIRLEVEQIASRIPPNSSVLDIGCANGFSTKLVADSTTPQKLYASDFSEPMVESASRVLKDAAPNVQTFVGDICAIDLPNETVDACYAIRVVINLPSWELQKKAILECLRVTRRGGVVLLSEGFWEPLARLNSIRMILGLKPLVEHDFNRYLKQERLMEWLTDLDLRFELIEFSSMYYLGSRIARELATDHQSYSGYSNPINNIFSKLARNYPQCGDIGVQKLLVINK